MSMSHGPGQAWWETHLDAIEREGIGTKAYAQREGLPVSSLYYWRRRLKVQKSNTPQPDKPASGAVARQFVPVKLGDGGWLRNSERCARPVPTPSGWPNWPRPRCSCWMIGGWWDWML